MKKFKLKILDDGYDYKENIIALIEVASPPQGLDFATVLKSIRLIDKLNGVKPGDLWQIEDADYAHLKFILENYVRFSKIHRPTINMINELINLKDE